MQVFIREAEKTDLPYILDIYNQPDMDDGEVLSLEEAQTILDKISTYPHYKLFVAVQNNEIIGTFALAIMDNLAHRGAKSGLIEDVVVKSEYQGNGVGKQMMSFAVEYCKNNKCYKVALSSNLKREKAHQFYESLGFVKHGYSFLLEL